MKRRGMGGHQSALMKSDEWLTPPDIVKRLGPFDLDVCAPVSRPWDTALKHFTVRDDGLSRRWSGYVWCNPPYGQETGKWLSKMVKHGNGLTLIFARTETRVFNEYVWGTATAMLFLNKRLHFHKVTGERAKANSGAPSVLVAYGEKAAIKLFHSGLKGAYVRRWVVL